MSKAFLELRNTPSQGVESSPAQRLLGRRTRAFVPTTSKRFRNNDQRKAKNGAKPNETSVPLQHNSEDLPILHECDTVRMKPFQLGEKKWGKAIVNKRLDERSYEVETNSGTYRRNRVHLRKSNEKPPDVHQRQGQLRDDRTARCDD